MVSRIIPVQDFDLTIFGGTGDLARRKILPGLYRRFLAGQMPRESRVIGAARAQLDAAGYQQMIREAIEEFGGPEKANSAELDAFLERLDYVPIDARGQDGWEALRSRLRPDVVRAFYFSVGPGLFGDLAERLQSYDIADAHARIVVEKPFGRDLASAKALNATLAKHFDEG